tara:strand:+ start:1221 stop:1532 length:312 start_codon:yes stop_codon:yes gene_type:complete
MENILLDIGGKEFYFDMDALSKTIRINSKDTDPLTEDKKDVKIDPIVQIDVAQFEMYRDFIGTLLNCTEIIDDKMGVMALNSLPIPFKLSFNTLLMKGIIKEL